MPGMRAEKKAEKKRKLTPKLSVSVQILPKDE